MIPTRHIPVIDYSRAAYTAAHNEMVLHLEEGNNPFDNQMVTEQVLGTLALVHHFIRNTHHHNTGPSVDRDDLEQAGFFAVMDSLRTYDPSLGGEFATLASLAIKRRIAREARQARSPLTVPVNLSGKIAGYLMAHAVDDISGLPELADELIKRQHQQAVHTAKKQDREPPSEEGIPARTASLTNGLTNALLSYSSIPLLPDGTLLSEPDDQDASPYDQAPDIDQHSSIRYTGQDELVDRALDVAANRETVVTTILPLIGLLPEKEKGIYMSRFPLDDTEPATLEALGGRYGMTREGIRQIILKINTALREAIESDSPQAYIVNKFDRRYTPDEKASMQDSYPANEETLHPRAPSGTGGENPNLQKKRRDKKVTFKCGTFVLDSIETHTGKRGIEPNDLMAVALESVLKEIQRGLRVASKKGVDYKIPEDPLKNYRNFRNGGYDIRGPYGDADFKITHDTYMRLKGLREKYGFKMSHILRLAAGRATKVRVLTAEEQ